MEDSKGREGRLGGGFGEKRLNGLLDLLSRSNVQDITINT